MNTANCSRCFDFDYIDIKRIEFIVVCLSVYLFISSKDDISKK